jgi:hypothetical protein
MRRSSEAPHFTYNILPLLGTVVTIVDDSRLVIGDYSRVGLKSYVLGMSVYHLFFTSGADGIWLWGLGSHRLASGINPLSPILPKWPFSSQRSKNYGRTRIEILTKRYFLGENFFQRNLGNGVGQFWNSLKLSLKFWSNLFQAFQIKIEKISASRSLFILKKIRKLKKNSSAGVLFAASVLFVLLRAFCKLWGILCRAVPRHAILGRAVPCRACPFEKFSRFSIPALNVDYN